MLNRKRIILSTLGVAVAIAFVLTETAGSNRQYQLGGGWIGNNGEGNIWNCLQIPLDSAGRSDAVRVDFKTYNAAIAGLLSMFGADRMSDFTGEGAMISRDTAKWTLVGYAQAQGNPPAIQGIIVVQGTWKYTTRDSALLNYTLYVYPAAADVDGDGLPDEGVDPFITIPGAVDTAQRVPLPGTDQCRFRK